MPPGCGPGGFVLVALLEQRVAQDDVQKSPPALQQAEDKDKMLCVGQRKARPMSSLGFPITSVHLANLHNHPG